MTLTANIAALKTVMAGVDGIRAAIIGQPGTLHNLPLAFLEVDTGERTYAAQVRANVARVRVSVCVARQGNTVAENELIAFIDRVPTAIDTATALQSAELNTVFRVTSWIADYFAFGDPEILTRRVVFTVEMTRKGGKGTA